MTAFDTQLNIATKASFFDCYNVDKVIMLTSKGYFALSVYRTTFTSKGHCETTI